MKTFPDKSIDCVITSPPYWQLRDYGWSGQWGMEKTFQEYLEHLWELMDEVWRVLKDTGTVWINLGDTYNGNKTGHTDNKTNPAVKLNNIEKKRQNAPDKCLLLIPHRFAIGCIDKGWIIRNDIVWAKRNGMPESVTDRFSKKHEYFFFMAKKDGYYFDLDSIRDSISEVSVERYKYLFTGQEGGESNNFKGDKTHLIPTTKIPKEGAELFGSPRARQHRNIVGNMDENGQSRTTAGLSLKTAEEKINPKGKNPGSVSDFWDVPTQPSKDAHYASYNTKLIDKPIVAGCPVGGIILDPFCGTATTGCRAIDLQRKFIGIEGKDSYVKIGNKKLRPYLSIQQIF